MKIELSSAINLAKTIKDRLIIKKLINQCGGKCISCKSKSLCKHARKDNHD